MLKFENNNSYSDSQTSSDQDSSSEQDELERLEPA